ncbi:MAG: hypothetical protein ABSG87_01875 [Verrucomicrobiota bacterium]|jgi:hypothetical protein
MNAKWKKALIVSLVGIVVLASGILVLDCIQYHATSVFIKYLENQPPQIKISQQTIDSANETEERIQNRIEMDAPMILLALFGLWCVPRALKEK